MFASSAHESIFYDTTERVRGVIMSFGKKKMTENNKHLPFLDELWQNRFKIYENGEKRIE